MKKIIFSIFLILVLSVGIFAEKLLSVSELPTSVTDFMKTYFPESQIVLAEYDDGKYDVKFTSNTDSDTLSGEAEFTKKGDWDKIEFYLGVPEEILPSEVLTTTSFLSDFTFDVIDPAPMWALYPRIESPT